MGFTPDGDYPLIFFEKGMTTLTVGRRKPKLDENILYFQGGNCKKYCISELSFNLKRKSIN